jgi:hypothetical protein
MISLRKVDLELENQVNNFLEFLKKKCYEKENKKAKISNKTFISYIFQQKLKL